MDLRRHNVVGLTLWTTRWEKMGASRLMRPALVGNGRSVVIRARSALPPACEI